MIAFSRRVVSLQVTPARVRHDRHGEHARPQIATSRVHPRRVRARHRAGKPALPASASRDDIQNCKAQARKDKAEKYAKLGDPIELKGIAIDLHIRGDYVWTAENSHVARKVDLEVR